jgi:Uma2 family endonuclease
MSLPIKMPPIETTLLTVEEYAKIPDPPGGRYELRHGELVFVSYPIFEHALIQKQFVRILDGVCTGWFVTMEFAFRPLPEYEVWAADAGMVTEQRFRASPKRGWLEGSPDLAIEVLSPSNTAQEINDRERICFEGGCREFWVVDPNLQTIRVSTPDGLAHTYGVRDEIPLDRFVPAKLLVTNVFADSQSIVSK